MTVQQSMASNLATLYNSLSAMGAPVPSHRNFANLPSVIGECNIGFQQLNTKTLSFFYDTTNQVNILYAEAFSGCTYLSRVSLPVCSIIGYGAFNGCRALTSISFPQCEVLSTVTFRSCYSLEYVSLPRCSLIGEYAFYSCSAINKIVVGTELSTVCVLSGTYVFSGTDFSLATWATSAAIYVPDSLVISYKNATNWRSVADFITSISRLPQN